MSALAALNRLHGLSMTLRRPGMGRDVAWTAACNVASTASAGLGGIIVARALGPAVRGEYAAITAWFGIILMVGAMGQPTALCFHVARDVTRARAYVATSRAMTVTTGIAALSAGMLLAPVLAHGRPGVADGYRIAFGVSVVAFAGACYTFSLQARDIQRWNAARTVQPVLSILAIAALWRLQDLTLDSALLVLAGTMLVRLIWGYSACRRVGLAPGRVDVRLVRPLAAYGTAQIAAATPAALNARLDQLVLSLAVRPADLGRYAVAVSFSLLPIPLVAAIGSVAFPRLASLRTPTGASQRIERLAMVAGASLAVAVLVPLAVTARWLVPLVYGPGYLSAVPLVWILTPGAVLLACGKVAGDLLRGQNRPLVVAWAEGFGVIFTLILLIVLLPFAGVAGAAIASTISYGAALAAMLHFLRRRTPKLRGPSEKFRPGVG